ncbi:DUF2075 domain-containing protein [Streptomyces griseoviridis]|uniref:AAA family ATPase n=1 Tax=Streptomyces griseoviridis TaxID=45398 RepID=A0A3S9ZQZ1_STRGD|nr:DUF2075 domain-containing protein [Streptomyces griseoviridis]AZS90098.1 DUF2075 domain-containing protein [Streptomyces griseoviridis]QCN85533.1 AAA family ATPase [Streptomyces griseoviridis]
MLLLRLSAQDLLTLNSRRRMVPHLAARWKHFRKTDASLSERAAWAESLVELAKDLIAADRGNVEMIVECAATADEAKDPSDQRLIDVVLAGQHPETSRPSFQLVELKRWSTVTAVEAATAELVHVPGISEPKQHPALQLGECYQLFTGDKGPLAGQVIECGGFTYLHNATEESVRPLLAVNAPMGPYARTYTKDRRDRLLADLRGHFAREGGDSAAELLLRGMNLRNTPLLDAMIDSRGEDTVFALRGKQKEVARDVLDRASLVLDDPAQPGLLADDRRAVFIITGGAGTGKSAVGLELKAEFEAAGRTVKYASGSRAFNGALQEYVGYGDKEFKESFTYFSNFVTPPEPPLDVLICDEAHRLRDRTTNRYLPAERQGTKPQVDELLDASRLTVFFLDGSQTVRPNEVGTVDMIENAAKARGLLPARHELTDQYRCGGSDGYVRWVRDLLGLTGDGPRAWTPDGLMHVEVADSPEELQRIIRTESEAGASARMVAGFCWPWSKPQGKGKGRQLEADVRIGDWHQPWNADSASWCENGTVPPSKIWSVDPAGIDQIGCVYTAQGLEWDWCGVIMGEDMVRRGDRWVFRRGKARKDPASGAKRVAVPGSFDPRLRGKKLSEDDFERCVRHAYHVLMTRASRATVLYSTDEETQEYLKKLIGDVQIHGLRPTWENLPPIARVPHRPRPKGKHKRSRNRKKKQQNQAQAEQRPLF